MAREGEPEVPINVPVGPPAHDRIYDYEVAPQQVATSPLHEVASALAPLSSDLQALGGAIQEKQNKADKAQAEKDFWNQNAAGNATALANGTLPHDKSPAYMDAWGSNAGLNDALRLQQSIGPQYNSLDKTTNDPQAFDKWFFPIAKGAANPAMENNEGYAKAWGSGIQRLHAEYAGRYVSDRSDAVKSGAQQEFTAAIGNQINVTWPTGTSPVDSQALAGQLDQIRAKALSAGMDPAFVEKSIIDVVHTKALDHKSVAILPVLDAMTRDPSDPNSAKLSATEYGAANTLQTAHAVQTLLIQDRDRQRTQQDQDDKDGYKTAVTGILGEWSRGNIQYAPTPAQIADASKHDPLFPTKLAEYRKNILANDTVEDPQAKVTLYEDLLANGGGQQAVMDAIGHGTLKTAQSIKEASEYATMVENYNKGGGAAKITEDPTFKRYVAVIESTSKDPKWVSSVTGGTGVTIGGRQAVNDLSAAAMNWQLQHPGAGPIERQKFLAGLGESVMSGFGGNDASGTQVHPYTRPAEVSTAVSPSPAAAAAPTAAPAAAPLPSPQAPGGSPAGSPGAPGPSGPAGGSGQIIDTPEKALAAIQAMPGSPKIEDLPKLGVTPEVIQEINASAAARGLTPQQLLDTLHAHAAQPPAAPTAPGKQSELDIPSFADEGPSGQTQQALAGNPLSFNIPGGGRIDLHGVDPGVAQQVTHMVSQLQRLAPGGDASAAPAATEAPATTTAVASTHQTLSEVPPSEGMASIRYNNPGAQWPNPAAERYGMLGYGVVGGGNKIAHFPSPVNGAASNMALLSSRYAGMTIGEAQTKWSGSHRSDLPGYDSAKVITPAMTEDPKFMIPFMKAMADAEAPKGGSRLSDEDWKQAFEMYHTIEGEHTRLAEK